MEENNNASEEIEIEDSEQAEEMSFFDKILVLITEPTALFRNLRIKPDWGLALVIYLLFVLASSALVTYYVTLPQLPQIIA